MTGQVCANDGTQNCGCMEGFFQPAGEGSTCQKEEASCDNNMCDKNARCSTVGISAQEMNDRGYACSCNEGFKEVANTVPGFECTVDVSVSPSAFASSEPSMAPVSQAETSAAPPPPPVLFCQRASTSCGVNEFCSAEDSACLCQRGFERDTSTDTCVCQNEITTFTTAVAPEETPTYVLTNSNSAVLAMGNFSGAPLCLTAADGIHILSVTDPENIGWEFNGGTDVIQRRRKDPCT